MRMDETYTCVSAVHYRKSVFFPLNSRYMVIVVLCRKHCALLMFHS
jgi:hypothetical protein